MFSKRKFARWLFQKYSLQRDTDTRISAQELEELRILYIKSIAVSAFIGVLFVLLYYIPIYLFPAFFNEHILAIKFWGLDLEIRWIRELDNFLLTYIELYVLSILSIYMIQRLASVLDFPSKESKYYTLHLENIEQLSLEVAQKREKELGLNPFLGLSKFQLFLFLLIARFKAMFSNMLIKFLLQRFASRFLLKTVIDLVGAPVYAFWNAYATAKLFKKSKYYIFSVELSDFLTEKLEKKDGISEDLRKEMQSILVSVVMLKREYSEINHYFSTKILETLNIQLEPHVHKPLKAKELNKVYSDETLRWIYLLFATGVILDGVVSRRERKLIQEFTHNFPRDTNPLSQIDAFLNSYKRGKAIEFITEKNWI